MARKKTRRRPRNTPRTQPAVNWIASACRGDRTLIMGIVNVTPDSFSDGGKFLSAEQAAAHAQKLADDGADIIDIGGESTRPGSLPVDPAEELSRVIPVIRMIARTLSVPISIDTTKAAVADEALKNGAQIINDTSALTDDPGMAAVARKHGCPVIIMHRKGTPREMQKNPRYADVVREIRGYFKKRVSYLTKCGIQLDKIIIDPGIGFGKTVSHNIQIINGLAGLKKLGLPIAVGVSRKSFIGALQDGAPADRRLAGSLAAGAVAVLNGARIVRAHDVKESKEFFRVIDKLKRPS